MACDIDGPKCKNKECNHLLNQEFIAYQWVTGNCTNPDCFYHTHDQDEVMPVYKDWRLLK